MVTATAPVHNGSQATPGSSVALGVASGGLRTLRHAANFTAALAIDSVRGTLGNREVNTAVRAMGETRRMIVDGQRVGYEKDVLDGPGGSNGDLAAEERELTARLEALRERRVG